MELRKAKIKNFRSIKNSNEWQFHKDRIQVLIGKNASGKTSIIDALEYFNVNIESIKEEDRPLDNIYTNTELTIKIKLQEKLDNSTILNLLLQKKKEKKILEITKLFTNYKGFNYRINGKLLHEYIENDIKEIIFLLNRNKKAKFTEDQYFLQVHNYYHNLNKMRESIGKLKNYIKDNEFNTNLEDFKRLEKIINTLNSKVLFLNDLIKKYSPVFVKFNYRLYGNFLKELVYDLDIIQENKLYQLIFNSMNLNFKDFITNKDNSSIISQLVNNRDGALEKYLEENWIRKDTYFLMKFHSNRFECLIKEQDVIENITQRSEGEIWFFTFLVYLYNKVDIAKNTIILIDEPSINLHPNAQRNIIIIMEKFLKNNPNLSIIYTTHSPYLVSPENLDRVLLVKKTKEKGTYIKQLDYQKLCYLRNKRKKRKSWPENIKARLLQMLTVSIREGFFGNIVVLCEGPTEFLSIPIWASLLGKSLDENGIILMQTAGKYIMIDYAELFSIFDIPVFLIFDNDRESDENKSHKKLNRWLLKFSGAMPVDYPANSGEKYFVFDPYYEKQLKRDDPIYREIEHYVSKKYDIAKKKGLKARYIAMRYLELNKDPPKSIKVLIETIYKFQENIMATSL